MQQCVVVHVQADTNAKLADGDEISIKERLAHALLCILRHQ